MSGVIEEITSKEQLENLKKDSLPLVVDFWAEWCGPCKRLAPVVEEVAAELNDKVKFAKGNVDNVQEVATDYQVMSIPTLLFFKSGEEVDRMVGAASKDALIKKIKTLFELGD